MRIIQILDGNVLLQCLKGGYPDRFTALVEVDHDPHGAKGFTVGVKHASGSEQIRNFSGDVAAQVNLIIR